MWTVVQEFSHFSRNSDDRMGNPVFPKCWFDFENFLNAHGWVRLVFNVLQMNNYWASSECPIASTQYDVSSGIMFQRKSYILMGKVHLDHQNWFRFYHFHQKSYVFIEEWETLPHWLNQLKIVNEYCVFIIHIVIKRAISAIGQAWISHCVFQSYVALLRLYLERLRQ